MTDQVCDDGEGRILRGVGTCFSSAIDNAMSRKSPLADK